MSWGKQQNKTVSIQRAHEELGHMDEEKTRAAAKTLNGVITQGNLKPCEACGLGKAKAKNILLKDGPKDKAKENNGRVYLDIS